ncbi:fibronectin type III domain-containing protein [Velocimicrobium porci]|mgnify:CR=1 FL=1|uniref:Fibronectin type-III domain-containing protein n=1 Tax=Velocimicrobium porci TaxID=2606634 RepID=A0A6L5Y069_9FIRM|nr:hypothetical protein [Velocimicrobium porci]MSS64111.1 hypothetical protein [Velocimicrobium porci]
MIKKLRSIICFFMTVICIVAAMPATISAERENMTWYMIAWADVKSPSKVTLHWKKQSVAGYDIYRAKVGKNEAVGKYTYIASVSGSKTSYSTKVAYKQRYSYLIKGYQKKNGKKVYKYEGEAAAYIGVGSVVWDEYFPVDAQISTSAITLMFNVSEGICPDGFEVYRKTAKTKYKKIKTLKNTKKESYIKFIDKTVKARQTYTYRVRSYKKIYGQKVYSSYTNAESLSAVNSEGKYIVKSVSGEKNDPTSITISITSDKDNGVTKLEDLYYVADYEYQKSKQDEVSSVEVIPIKYSWNQKDWTELSGTDSISLKAGKTLFITYSTFKKETIPDDIEDYETAQIVNLSGRYNGFHAIIDMDLIAKTGKARINGEVYH